MTNNDIFRRLRYTFDINDVTLSELFALGDMPAKRTEINAWLKKEEDPEYVFIPDKYLAAFLNGFITSKRGKREGEKPAPEVELSNNNIFRKLKIALNLKDDDIIEILALVDMKVSKHEISAFFRNPSQKQYRPCKDQMLRNFLHGLQLRYHPDDKKENKIDVKK